MTREQKSQMKHAALIMIGTLIWGTAFVAQSVGADYLDNFSFTAFRNLIGGTFLIPVIFLFRAKHLSQRPVSENTRENTLIAGGGSRPVVTRYELIAGIVCGVALFFATNAQQMGLATTTTARAGFLTAMYVIYVPIIGIFLRRRVKPIVWLCVALAIFGMYNLCLAGSGLSLAPGDTMELFSGIFFAIHIMVIDHYAPRCDGAVLSCIQFYVSAILSAIIMFVRGVPDMHNVRMAIIPLLYAGVLSSGVAFTLQVVAQRHLNPTIAGLLMCLESVISAISGWIVLNEALSPQEIFGCAVMFAAIVIATLFG